MASKRLSDSRKGNNVNPQPPQWNDFLVCSLCKKDFNRRDRCPISLGCGHTVCKACLKKMKQACCQFDQIPITCNVNDLPINSALLQLLPGESQPNLSSSVCRHTPNTSNAARDSVNISQYVKNYEKAKSCIEHLALYLEPSKNGELSRPMQRKLVTLVNCQLFEDEGRKRAIRAGRALGERTATELILLHQNPATLSASLWAAVRARGCQFLGPAMQEEALKLIHLALEDGSELSRKVLVQIVVKNLKTQFTQASKTSIGHVVQLLYRASCFRVTKRDNDSSLMRLKDDFLIYEDLRKEHDMQVVQIAREAGLRIAPDQWSALLYGDQSHRSHMQSIIDRLQSGASFAQCISDLSLALQRSGDPGDVKSLISHFNLLSELDAEDSISSWDAMEKCACSAKEVVDKLVDFSKNHNSLLWQCQESTQQTSKYKTSMCRDSKNKSVCPRGQSCTFAHSEGELQFYRNRRKKGGALMFFNEDFSEENSTPKESAHIENNDQLLRQDHQIAGQISRQDVTSLPPNVTIPCGHTCQCGRNIPNNTNQAYDMQNPAYFQGNPLLMNSNLHNPNIMSNHPPLPSQDVIHPMPVAVHPPRISPQSAVVPAQNPHTVPHAQHSQVQYIGSSVVYGTKPPLNYDLSHPLVANNSASSYHHKLDVNHVPIPKPVVQTSAIQQQGHYVMPSGGYCHIPSNQVLKSVPDPGATPNPLSPAVHTGQSYGVNWQSGQQVSPPNVHHQVEVLPHVPVMVQPQPIAPTNIQAPAAAPVQNLQISPTMQVQNIPPPSVPVHNIQPGPTVPAQNIQPNQSLPVQNLAPGQVLAYQPPGIMPTAPANQSPNMPLVQYFTQTATSNTEALNNTVKAFTQYNLTVTNNSPKMIELAKLNMRKNEVINKLVQKRITAPKLDACQQQQYGTYQGLLDKTTELSIPAADGEISSPPETTQVMVSATQHMTDSSAKTTIAANEPSKPTTRAVKSPVHIITQGLKLMPNGQYQLWTGSTCLPSISGLSFHDIPFEKSDQQSPSIIDVTSDLDTSTSHVSATHDNSQRVSYTTPSRNPLERKHGHKSARNDDDIVSIQDQRIVSKYGPIARGVRSKTTSAIPEQVTANANSNTQPFASDVNRNVTNFVPDDGNSKKHNNLFISAEVEPSSVEKVNVQPAWALPDLVMTNPSNPIPVSVSGHPDSERILMEAIANQVKDDDENEDLLLAIELQQIEVGIRQIQRGTNTKLGQFVDSD
ncbi:uncharacterized protein LOC143447551 [Clavelina lepadiformis]|uniref:uncharacterized protein LOC143447551 n=1 Tax=Clavelina lepadiformis TaxID=159417 RepID=UPI00404156DC